MILMPFETYSTGAGIACPMCKHVHTLHGQGSTVTEYCIWQHDDVLRPSVNTTQNNSKPQPHLHRTCIRCRYVWLEETAVCAKLREDNDGKI